MNPQIAIHYDEIGLKGENRPFFEKTLCRNIAAAFTEEGPAHVRSFFGRILLQPPQEYSWQQICNILRRISGIAHFERVWKSSTDFQSIVETADRVLPAQEGLSFQVRSNRADKSFPIKSPEINRILGAEILKRRNWKVDLTNAEITLYVTVVGTRALISCEKIPGPGGLPLGVSGKVVCLLSAGIDSPVAAYRLMRRGAPPVFVHFHSYPLTGKASQESALRTARLLLPNGWECAFWLIPLRKIQQNIIAQCPEKPRVLLYRRFMLKLAERVALREGAKALVTGEALGQVSSQTMENLAAVGEAVSLPLLRPLIGFDKKEITKQARNIGTYQSSYSCRDDACSYLLPRYPETRASATQLAEAENKLPLDELLSDAFQNSERRIIKPEP